jgi:histidyl-tRNA synthetase
MRAAGRRCGFQELETPSLESLDLFRVKSGEELSQQVWSFSDKGGREVALVAETTPSLARVFVDRAKSEPLPVKWMTISRLWRYEEPQAGRTREFTQLNLDILGVPGVEAETDLLASASLVLDEVGAAGTYAFRLNDRKLIEGLGGALGARDPLRFFRALDRRGKVPTPEFERGLREAGLAEDAVRRLDELLGASGTGVAVDRAPQLLDRFRELHLPPPGPEGLERLATLSARLTSVGLADRIVLDPTVVRGLAYYTSTVFEAFDRAGDLRSLFGGGRYDELVQLFGGPPTPAVGLAIGDQTLELLLRAHDRWPDGESPLDTYVVAVTAEQLPQAFEWVQKLRRAGVSADCDLMARSLSRQLKEAARRRARRALLLGPREAARGVLLERELATGAQRERTPDEVLPTA